jgi:iron complex outermembrane receptor protein
MLASSSLRTALFTGTAVAAVMFAMPAAAQVVAADQGTTAPAVAPSGAETPVASATVVGTSDDGNEIIVTGSRIRRDPNDSPLPLQIITTQELERNGISNPEQFISYLTTNGTGTDNLASNADVVAGAQRGNNGASFANLRSQGSGATLVLLNNRRIAAHGLQGSAVDVNQIPFAAIERVEVLKEGASAIYGTDAIGGVINFILRKDYQGIGVQGFVDVAEEGDHSIYRTSAIAGYGDLEEQGFNVMGAVAFSDVPELRGDQRSFVNTFQPDRGLSVDTRGTPFGTVFPLAGTFFPNAASTPFVPGSTTVRASGGINVLDLPGREGCGSIPGQAPYDAELWLSPTSALACAWDTGRAAVLQQPLETLTWVGRAVARFGEHEVSVEATGSDANAIKRFSNVQLTPNTTSQNYAHPVGAPGYETVYQRLVQTFPELGSRARAPLAYRWRCIECGRREIETDTQTARYTLGADGPLFTGWDYRAGLSYSESESTSVLGSGYYFRGTLANGTDDPNAPLAPGATRRGIIGLLNSGLINPFLLPGQTQSQAALDALRAVSAEGTVLYGGKYSLTQADASVSGPVFDLPAGSVRAAFGVDYRKEKYRFNGDVREASSRPFIIAAPFDDLNALQGVSREIKAIYAEALIPILDSLEVTVAGRIDDYGDFGTTENPMVNFKFRPIEQLMFRGNYNTAFRVPAFNQLFNGTLESLYTGSDIADPATCPGGQPSTAPGCASLERAIDVLNGGNLGLQPETAEMYSLGVVFEPSRNFSASVDFFSISRDNTIQILTLPQLVGNFALFEDRFIRNSAGVLTDIDQSWVNVGGSKTEGLEIVLRGGLDVGPGRALAGLDATYLTKRTEQLIAGGATVDQLGVFTVAGDLGLKWKHNAFIGYTTDDWNLTFTQIWRDGYRNQALPGVASGTVTRPNIVSDVDEYVIYNLSVAYSGLENLRLTFGVKNLFDTDPPFAISYDSFGGSGSSWEPRVADPRGRSFTLSAEIRF